MRKFKLKSKIFLLGLGLVVLGYFFTFGLPLSLPNKTSVKAQTYPGNLSGKFQETEVFSLTSPSQIYGWFTTNHKLVTHGSNLPPTISFSGSEITITDKGGIVIQNPLPSSSFYRVEVELVDENQSSLTGLMTLIDNLWSNGQTTNGLSVGIDTANSPATYWYDHTQLKTQGQLPQDQYNFSRQAQSKFIRRKAGNIKIAFYLTPVGIYPVVDGANFASFPDLYTGSYTYNNTHPINYIVLGKWNAGENQVKFRSLKIYRLDNSINNVDEVNAYFIKRTMESNTFSKLVSDETNFNGTAGFQNAIWAALLYRGYDYYFKTNHISRVRHLVDLYLRTLPSYIDQNISRYGHENTLYVNHSFINSIQSNPLVIYGLSGYLRQDQMMALKEQFARVVDKSTEYIKTDGSFPETIQYKGDTFAEEVSWLLSFYTGYYVNFPNDQPRSVKILDYLTFLGFHHLSSGKSIRQVYGDNINFNYLGNSYKDFISQYIWRDGSIDNHELHPSLNYGQGIVGTAALVKNVLEKKGVIIPTLSHNLKKAYLKTVKSNLDINSFHLKHPNSRWGIHRQNLNIEQDVYAYASDGSIIDFIGQTNPSLVEDWANTYTNYQIIENYGDYGLSLPFAKNVYYGYYSGAGKLFCGHVNTGNGQRCSAGTNNFFNYIFGDALYTMLFSPRSSFDPMKICEENIFKKKVWQGDLTWTCDQVTKKEGRASIKLNTGQFSNAETYSPLIKALPNQTYKVSYWVKTQNLQPSNAQVYGRLVTAQYNSHVQEVEEVNQNRIDAGFGLGENVGGTIDWVKKSYTFRTNLETRFIRFRAPMGLAGRAKGTVWFDQVKIEKAAGDLNGDGQINGEDVKVLLSRYQTNNTDGDLNADGMINGVDFGRIRNNLTHLLPHST